MICKNCGTQVPDTDRFCTHCGNDLEKQREEMAALASKPTCPHCGAPMNEGDLFCMTCGKKASDPVEAQAEEKSVEEPATEETPAEEPKAEEAETAEVPEEPTSETVPAEESKEENAVEEPTSEDVFEQAAEDKVGDSTAPIPPLNEEPQFNIPHAEEVNKQQAAKQAQFQAKQEKSKKEKKQHNYTPLLVALIIILVAAIAVGATYLVMNNRKSDDLDAVPSTTISQSAVEDGTINNGPQYLDETTGSDAESELDSLTMTTIQNTPKNDKWRDPALMEGVYYEGSEWIGNDYIVYCRVAFDYDHAEYVKSIENVEYYTYVRYHNVYSEDGVYKAESKTRPSGKLTNMYDSSAHGTVKESHHKVSGYSTLSAASSAAHSGTNEKSF